MTAWPSSIFVSMHRANSAAAHSLAHMIAMNLIWGLYAGEADVVKILTRTIVWIVPSLNIDGYVYIMESGDLY